MNSAGKDGHVVSYEWLGMSALPHRVIYRSGEGLDGRGYMLDTHGRCVVATRPDGEKMGYEYNNRGEIIGSASGDRSQQCGICRWR